MIKEYLKQAFNGGLTSDKRDANSNQFAGSLNFDIYKTPSLLLPIRDYETDEGYNGSDTGIRTSDLACFGDLGSSVYAIGRKNDGTGRKIYNKSLSSSTWLETTASNGSAAEATDGCAVPGFFIRQFTSNGSSMYWFVTCNGSTPTTGFYQLGLMDFSTSAAASFSKKTLAFNPTFIPQAILGKDGSVYVSDNHKLHECASTGTVTDSVFTVTPNWKITSLCLYDDYLAIAIYGQGKSKVLLWDYNQAQASEVIEWGSGCLTVLENIDGYLVGVTDKFINSTLFGAGANGSGLMEIKIWSGGFSGSISIPAYGSVAGAIQQFKYLENGVLKWYAKIPQIDGTNKEGVWAFGRTNVGDSFALSLQREVPGTFEGFWGVSNYLYFPHSEDGHVSRTNDSDSFTLTSFLETEIIDDDNPTVEKNTLGAFVTFEALSSGETIALKYRKDGDTTWTTLQATPAIATGDLSAFFPIDVRFREMELRAESSNGAVISSIRLRYEVLKNQVE